jgi:hypothetical protein
VHALVLRCNGKASDIGCKSVSILVDLPLVEARDELRVLSLIFIVIHVFVRTGAQVEAQGEGGLVGLMLGSPPTQSLSVSSLRIITSAVDQRD